MQRDDVIQRLTQYFYDANCTDRSLMMEWIQLGANLPGFANMTNDELIQEWDEMFDEVITVV